MPTSRHSYVLRERIVAYFKALPQHQDICPWPISKLYPNFQISAWSEQTDRCLFQSVAPTSRHLSLAYFKALPQLPDICAGSENGSRSIDATKPSSQLQIHAKDPSKDISECCIPRQCKLLPYELQGPHSSLRRALRI
jgi:hypothetical protein